MSETNQTGHVIYVDPNKIEAYMTPNVRIYVTDNFEINAVRKKPFNRFQRWMMWACFGWKVEVIE